MERAVVVVGARGGADREVDRAVGQTAGEEQPVVLADVVGIARPAAVRPAEAAAVGEVAGGRILRGKEVVADVDLARDRAGRPAGSASASVTAAAEMTRDRRTASPPELVGRPIVPLRYGRHHRRGSTGRIGGWPKPPLCSENPGRPVPSRRPPRSRSLTCAEITVSGLPCATSPSSCARARRSPCWDPTAPARRPCCGSWRPCFAPPPARSRCSAARCLARRGRPAAESATSATSRSATAT